MGSEMCIRDRPGDIVAFDDTIQFPALLWNNEHTNKLVYVTSGADFLERVNALGATWVFCREGGPNCTRFQAPGSGWHDVGSFQVGNVGRIYSRADD